MLSVNDAFLHDGRHLRLQQAFAKLVVDPRPLSVSKPRLASIGRVDLKQRIRIELTAIRNLTILGVEERIRASTRSEDERVLIEQARRGDGAVLRLLIVRKRLVSETIERIGP